MEVREVSQVILEMNSVYWRCQGMLEKRDYTNIASVVRCLFVAKDLLDNLWVVCDNEVDRATLSALRSYFDTKEQPNEKATNFEWVVWMRSVTDTCYNALCQIKLDCEARSEKK